MSKASGKLTGLGLSFSLAGTAAVCTGPAFIYEVCRAIIKCNLFERNVFMDSHSQVPTAKFITKNSLLLKHVFQFDFLHYLKMKSAMLMCFIRHNMQIR